MTTVKQTFLNKVADWLDNILIESDDQKYRYRCLKENLYHRSDIVQELKNLVYLAHEDARARLRRLLAPTDSLDPLGELSTPGSQYFTIDEYPKKLHIDVLKGYFGEIFAGIIAENFNPFGENWEVPAFPFRFHNTAFEQLEMLRQVGGVAWTVPGRTGDDLLAFQRDANGKIVRSLVCEAKCTAGHNSTMVKEAHEKASAPNPVPISYTQLIDILNDQSDDNPSAAAWSDALRQLRFITSATPNYERCDLVSYICGLPPVRESTIVIPQNKPHEKYIGRRRLEAVETHLYDVEGLIEQIYEKEDDFIAEFDGGINLDEVWQQVVAALSPEEVRLLVREHCCLLNCDKQKALIGVRSLSHFRNIMRREDNLRRAFTTSGIFQPPGEDEKIKVKLRHILVGS